MAVNGLAPIQLETLWGGGGLLGISIGKGFGALKAAFAPFCLVQPNRCRTASTFLGTNGFLRLEGYLLDICCRSAS